MEELLYGQGALGCFHKFHGIAHGDLPGLHNTYIGTGETVVDKLFQYPLVAKPDAQFVTGFPGLRDLDQCGAKLVGTADSYL